MSVDYSLELCYGVIVPDEVVEKFIQISEEFDDFRDNFVHQIDSWSGGDWFVGITVQYLGGTENLVHEMDSDFLATSIKETVAGTPWKEFSEFYNSHNLKEYFDWKPKLYLINFCY